MLKIRSLLDSYPYGPLVMASDQAIKSTEEFFNTLGNFLDEEKESAEDNLWEIDSFLVDLQFIFVSFVFLTGIPG